MIRFERVPLIKGLKLYTEEKNARFHMPGHRNEDENEGLSYLRENLFHFDVTEIEGTDNLHYPEEIIKESQMLLAEAMGAHESLYCINGSTASNYAMIFGLLKRNDAILVQRNCHQSIYNAIALLDLQPAYLIPEVIEEYDLPSTVSLEELKRVHRTVPDARAVILTSPTYHGTVADVEALSAYCRENGLYLLVDEAHGAHFSFSEQLPQPSITIGAHASSVSFHKTLPAMTQGSVLNLSDLLSDQERSRIRHYHRVFQSSSPSYPLLCSMEMARYYMEENGEQLYEELIRRIDMLKAELLSIPGVKVLSEKESGLYDRTRLVVNTPLSGVRMDEFLRRAHRIQCEMTEGRNIIFILTPSDHEEDLMSIAHAVKDARNQNKLLWNERQESSSSVTQAMNYPLMRKYRESDVLFMEDEEIGIKDAHHRVSSEKIVPYPPGIPLILPGEVISDEVIKTYLHLRSQGANILRSGNGNDDTINVVKE